MTRGRNALERLYHIRVLWVIHLRIPRQTRGREPEIRRLWGDKQSNLKQGYESEPECCPGTLIPYRMYRPTPRKHLSTNPIS